MAHTGTQLLDEEFDLAAYLKTVRQEVDAALDRYLPGARVKPTTLHKAMRYSVFAGGKRLRPALCLAAAEACGGNRAQAMPLACALECVHTYSLIHDDLPAMDNDDLRRGKPTCHKVFGEATAILAGDALLTVAFEIAAQCRGWRRYGHKDVFIELAQAAGSKQLVGGQIADLEGEGKAVTEAQLRYIHERKTSALLCCATRLGGMAANCNRTQLNALSDFGYYVGLAFQVIDDILDVTQSSEQLGKTAGKDAAVGKATYPAVVGLEKSRRVAKNVTGRAFSALEGFHGRVEKLRIFGEYLLNRDR